RTSAPGPARETWGRRRGPLRAGVRARWHAWPPPRTSRWGRAVLCESASLQHPRIGVHAEPRPLRHGDAPVDGVDGVAERVPREVAVEALDQRLTGHRGDTVDRGEQAGTEVRRVRDDGDAERLGEGGDAAHLGHAADLGHARLGIVDGARLEGPAELPGGAVVLA